MTRFSKCDILRGKNDVQSKGFEIIYKDDKLKDELEMIGLAIKHKCPILVKDGHKGKWYLKGQGKSIDYLKSKIEENIGESRDGVYCLLIEFE
jgi:hypothetical protein